MPELPAGTVCFFFTDIEGSTRLWESDPRAMRTAVTRHDTLLSDAISAYHGFLYKHIGDAIQAAFSSASDALAAAVAAQRALAEDPWPETGPLRVRMALHIGEAAPDARGDYHQIPALNRLARLLAAGHGGQILLTGPVQDRVQRALPDGTALIDLGKHRLRDLLEPERVSQVVIAGLPQHFPPLKSLERHPTNLPVQPNELIGRERDLAALHQLLTDETVRLVTLSGPGGTGKTRLALQAGAEFLDQFEDGVFVVDLAPLSDPDLVLTTIATTLGLREGGGLSSRESVAAYLAEKRLLLILDNYEHLLDAARIAGDLLAASPGLRIIATSRESLRLKAEREYLVAPLDLPTSEQLRTGDLQQPGAAMTLFLQRAQAAKADFRLTEENASTIAQICLQLDGLPLAIELAAARVKLLPPAALLARLERRLPLLTGGARDAPERQRTLRDTIAWSHDLLTSDEQALFRRLAVFSGGGTLEAVEAVVNPDGRLLVFDGLTSLVDKSLVRQSADGNEPRFGMLETIREFALEQLDRNGEANLIRRGQASWCLSLAEQAEPFYWGPQQRSWLERLETDHANFRAALAWLLQEGDAEGALRLGGALGWFWYLGSHYVEGRSWLEQGLAVAATTPSPVLAKALTRASGLASVNGDGCAGVELAERSLAVWSELGERSAETSAAVFHRGFGWLVQGDGPRAEAGLAEALDYARAVGDKVWAGIALLNLANFPEAAGNIDEAAAMGEEALELQREISNPWGIRVCLAMLGSIAVGQGDCDQARAVYRESLALAWEDGDGWMIAACLTGLAMCDAIDGQAKSAAHRFGAAQVLRDVIGPSVLPVDGTIVDRLVAETRDHLGEQGFAQAWAAGRALPLEQAVTEALEGSRPSTVLAATAL